MNSSIFSRERVRDAHMLAVAPELRVLALGHLVVGDDEVADRFVLKAHLVVEPVDQDRVGLAHRKEVEELGDRRLDEMDAGRFQRFEEPARQAEREAVLDPRRLAPPGLEAEHFRRRQAQSPSSESRSADAASSSEM